MNPLAKRIAAAERKTETLPATLTPPEPVPGMIALHLGFDHRGRPLGWMQFSEEDARL